MNRTIQARGVTRFAWRRTRYFSSVFAGFPTCGSPSIQPSAVSSCANLHRYCPRKWYTSIPSIPASNTPFIQHSIQPQVYSSISSCWSPLESSPTRRFLRPEELLRVVSWNIDFMAPGREQRGYQAMDHLRDHLGQTPPPVAVLLQEVHAESLDGILKHPWVRNNFVLSNVEAPQRYFTIMMVSKHIETEKWFRVPLESKMERDALLVDIPLSPFNGKEDTGTNILRLCTTHLESLPEGKELRPRQLAQISALLKAPPRPTARIVGGVVGGDMNSILPSDQEIHKAPGVDLHDVWEDIPPPPIPPRVPFKKDLTFGRARGNTWGYQGKSHSRKRLDKFFYTGLVDMVMLDEVQDRAGKVGRLGIGVKTKVTALEWVLTLGDIMYLNPSDGIEPGRLVELDAWISDHFAIAIGVRVKKEEGRGSVVHGGL